MVNKELEFELEDIAELAEIAVESGRNISYVGRLHSDTSSLVKTVILAQNPVEKLNELFLNLPEEERKKEFSGLYIEREMLEGVPVKGEITEKNLFLITDGLVLSDMPKYAGVDVYNRMFFNGQLSEENEEATIYRGVWHLGATALDRENLSPAKRDLVMQYRDGTFTFTRENGLYLPK